MRIFSLTILFFIIILNPCIASENMEVKLGNVERLKLTPPSNVSTTLKLQQLEKKEKLDEEDLNYFTSEKDVAESKLEEKFYNFIDERVINNKINRYSYGLTE